MPRAVEAEAPPVSRLITITLTRQELTNLLNALSVSVDEARKDLSLHRAPRSPAYRQARIEDQRRGEEAAESWLRDTAELYNMVRDRWKEER